MDLYLRSRSDHPLGGRYLVCHDSIPIHGILFDWRRADLCGEPDFDG